MFTWRNIFWEQKKTYHTAPYQSKLSGYWPLECLLFFIQKYLIFLLAANDGYIRHGNFPFSLSWTPRRVPRSLVILAPLYKTFKPTDYLFHKHWKSRLITGCGNVLNNEFKTIYWRNIGKTSLFFLIIILQNDTRFSADVSKGLWHMEKIQYF